jgi:hypothetical protein
VAAAQDRDQRLLDHLVLPEDDVADRFLGGLDVRGGRLRGAHHHVFEFLEAFDRHDSSCLLCSRFHYQSGGLCRASLPANDASLAPPSRRAPALILLSYWSLQYFWLRAIPDVNITFARAPRRILLP